ncbi:subunit D of V-type proton ATPase [Hamiltosporidium tvaerminnensis]|uniref:Subunit D of V-type proton ATPase n=2 Tax=Hamiltosporidium TaxID=1176354 RepID=A0A4V2JVQ4_9MICR|nr:H(+)-transporting V1 sector ATPase subunit D [Hamiltosporidium tvaerminnensis]TBU03074.1 subunit D of V-type proton ATPase [Hamiltosporidium magnivora]TBU04855.1 subunit D of V-type proton ATPase [Hamiltosporidium tvaerminnensis]TBU05012.1 subunit D of V-type proton ATPase [Hamiltosporidium magnivora]TBU20210.1 subunit D of V-type proton ATPase [Hamiltosporidium tvaerminnensis]
MACDQRFQIFATRMNLVITMTRLKSAERGHMLLKRKSDALQKRYREIQLQLEEERKKVSKMFRQAYISISEAEFHGGNFKMFIHECKKVPINVQVSIDQVSGVTLPSFTINELSLRPLIFLDTCGKSLNKCRQNFISVFKLLIEVATLQNSFKILNEVLKSTNRRVNALEFLLIPKLNNTISYINAELDEHDREEFFRLKTIQKLKK